MGPNGVSRMALYTVPELSYTCIFPGAGDRYLISYFRVGLSGFRIGNTDGLSDFIDQPGATFV